MFMEILATINYILGILFFVCYSYQIFYIFVPAFKKHKAHKEPVKESRLAVLVSARNEEKVIGGLLDSINKQDYDPELIKVFVVADNCSPNDNTANIAREHGAIVYERKNLKKVGKGYALNWLLKKIEKDGYWNEIDAFLVFDADNILKKNYISEMNKTFSDGFDAITSYRNSKNYGDNWISAGYSLWFLRESKYLNNSRMLLGTSCAISGTGFLVSRQLIEKYNGWNFFLLTEDIEFSVCNVVNGVRIGYCPNAELYDEQPVKFTQSWKQRLRWAKGFLQVWKKYGRSLIKNIFSSKFFSCFDMTMNIMPAFVISTMSILVSLIAVIVGLIARLDFSRVLWGLVGYAAYTYAFMFIIGVITTITEWKNIHCRSWKKILYTFTFPLFMFTYIPISIVAIVKRVTWEPIEHTRSKRIEDMGISERSDDEEIDSRKENEETI